MIANKSYMTPSGGDNFKSRLIDSLICMKLTKIRRNVPFVGNL